jgi:transposase
MASRLFALEGVEVVEVDVKPGGGRTVWVVTADPAARVCPVCRTASEHVKEQVVTRPADVGYGREQVSVVWVKRRWECRFASCPRKTFTESLPAIPPRCRMTARLRDHAGWLVAEGGRTVMAAARECGLSWPVAQEAFVQHADPLLGQPPSPVAHLGIDEHRRGRPRWRADEQTGEYVLLADRWHTCFLSVRTRPRSRPSAHRIARLGWLVLRLASS